MITKVLDSKAIECSINTQRGYDVLSFCNRIILSMVLGLVACGTLCPAQDFVILQFRTEACAVDNVNLTIVAHCARFQSRVPGGKLRESALRPEDIFLLSIPLEDLRNKDYVAIEPVRLVLPTVGVPSFNTPFQNSLSDDDVFINYPYAYGMSNDEYSAWRIVDSPGRWELLAGFPSKTITTDKDYQKYGEIFVSPKYPGDIRDQAQSKIIGPALWRITSKILESTASPRVRVLFAGEFDLTNANYNASFKHTTVSFVDLDGKYSFEVDFEKYFRLTDDGLEPIRGNAVPVTKSKDVRIP